MALLVGGSALWTAAADAPAAARRPAAHAAPCPLRAPHDGVAARRSVPCAPQQHGQRLVAAQVAKSRGSQDDADVHATKLGPGVIASIKDLDHVKWTMATVMRNEYVRVCVAWVAHRQGRVEEVQKQGGDLGRCVHFGKGGVAELGEPLARGRVVKPRAWLHGDEGPLVHAGHVAQPALCLASPHTGPASACSADASCALPSPHPLQTLTVPSTWVETSGSCT